MSIRTARVLLLAALGALPAVGSARALDGWRALDGLADVRHDESLRLEGSTLEPGSLVELPWGFVVDGARHDLLAIGPGWVQPVRRVAGRLPASSTAEANESLRRAARIDVLSGRDVLAAPGSEILVRIAADGAAIRWTALTVPTGGIATVELLIDRLGGVSLQYLRMPADCEFAWSNGLLRAAGVESGLPAPLGPTAHRLDPTVLAPYEGPRPDESGPAPLGCDPAVGTWCEIADGPGDALVFLAEGFDDGASTARGWAGTDLWHEVDFATCAPGATVDPGRSWYYGRNAGCQYLDSRTGSLRSPVVGPVSGASQLAFSLRMGKEDAGFPFPVPIDLAEVLINGIPVASYLTPPDPALWYVIQPIPLNNAPAWDFTGQNVTVEFRFTSDVSVTNLGWLVDDVVLWDDNGANAGCAVNAGLGGTAPCDQRASDQWDFNEGAFCQGCDYTFYILVECGREMHIPMSDMEGADVRVTDLVSGLPVALRCSNDTARADAGMGPYPVALSGDCCVDPGLEEWWGPAFDETDSAGPGQVAWGFPDCPNVDLYDRNGDGLTCNELPGCGGELTLITPGEGQVMDCSINDESGLCGIYRVDVTSGGFVWSLFANCDGTDRPEFPIYFDCTEAWAAFTPLPELAIADLSSSPGCPNLTLSFELQNIGCADQLGDVPVRLLSDCVPADSADYLVPGPIPAGGSVAVDLDFVASCAPVVVEVIVDPDDTILECTESPTAAACRAAEGVDSLSVASCTCSITIGVPPTGDTICVGDTTTLDASGITFDNCLVAYDYEWSDASGVIGTAVSIDVSPTVTTDYTVIVSCPGDPDCVATETVRVVVEAPPIFTVATASDFAPCNLGIQLFWDAATFQSGAGTGSYNLYRSEIDCADALTRPPLATGLSVTTFFDDTTLAGPSYHYVVEAEDSSFPTPCRPQGPANGGAVTRICLPPEMDRFEPSIPDGVYATLFARHQAQELTLYWDSARVLLLEEHFHLLKARDDASGSFARANPEADLSLFFTETDVSSRLQFFDLRVANECEQESEDEFPPG